MQVDRRLSLAIAGHCPVNLISTPGSQPHKMACVRQTVFPTQVSVAPINMLLPPSQSLSNQQQAQADHECPQHVARSPGHRCRKQTYDQTGIENIECARH